MREKQLVSPRNLQKEKRHLMKPDEGSARVRHLVNIQPLAKRR